MDVKSKKIPCYLNEQQLTSKLFDLQEQLTRQIEIHKEELIEMEQPIFAKQLGLQQKQVQEGKEEAFENFLRKDQDIVIKELSEEQNSDDNKQIKIQQFNEPLQIQQEIINDSLEKIIVTKDEEESYQISTIPKKKKLKKLAAFKDKPKNKQKPDRPLNQFQRLKYEATLVLPTLDTENNQQAQQDEENISEQSDNKEKEQEEDNMILKKEEEQSKALEKSKIDPTLVLQTLNEDS